VHFSIRRMHSYGECHRHDIGDDRPYLPPAHRPIAITERAETPVRSVGGAW
jgi:hypothetical protein